MNIYFIGPRGSDAGSWWITSDGKVGHSPGWGPESMADLSRAINIIREASQIKTPGVAEAAIHSVLGFAQKEFAANVKGGGIVVIG